MCSAASIFKVDMYSCILMTLHSVDARTNSPWNFCTQLQDIAFQWSPPWEPQIKKENDGMGRTSISAWSWSYHFLSSVCKLQNFHKFLSLFVFSAFSPRRFLRVFANRPVKLAKIEWGRMGKRQTGRVLGFHFLTTTWLEQPITLIGRVDIL